jgi:hypothetical protein
MSVERNPSGDAAHEPCLACGHAGDHASWCGPDYLAQERVAISDKPGRSVPEHVLAKPTVGALRAGADLEAVKAWKPKMQAIPLTDDEREWVHDRIAALAAERAARSDSHRERIRSTAAWLGHQVRKHKVTLADAQARLDPLLMTFDPESAVPIVMVPFAEAKQIAADAFTSTFKGKAHG